MFNLLLKRIASSFRHAELPGEEADAPSFMDTQQSRRKTMPNNRTDAVVSAIVDGVRQALRDHDVTFEEFRMGIGHLQKTAEAKELPLLIDLFFNTTIVENTNKDSEASPNDLQGPYFIEDVPDVTASGVIKTMPHDKEQPMLLRGHVRDTTGAPVEGATLWIWSSTPDGKYGGFHDKIPGDFYRGKITTGANGEYLAESTVPVPYQIPHSGPTGALLDMMGRHSWRPAHVHYKVRKPGFKEMTTQAYFEGGDWVDDDCCEGKHTNDFVIPEKYEDGKRLMDVDFIIEPAA